jgi:hypothetical protein
MKKSYQLTSQSSAFSALVAYFCSPVTTCMRAIASAASPE